MGEARFAASFAAADVSSCGGVGKVWVRASFEASFAAADVSSCGKASLRCCVAAFAHCQRNSSQRQRASATSCSVSSCAPASCASSQPSTASSRCCHHRGSSHSSRSAARSIRCAATEIAVKCPALACTSPRTLTGIEASTAGSSCAQSSSSRPGTRSLGFASPDAVRLIAEPSTASVRCSLPLGRTDRVRRTCSCQAALLERVARTTQATDRNCSVPENK
jgi:hypothetical protein